MKKISIVSFVVIVIGVFSIIICYNYVEGNNIVEIKFDKCVDGDTAWFIINGEREKIRILGIDTPESTNYVEEYGIEASKYTCNVLENAKHIYLEYDINSDRYDKYKRVLGWVFVDNNNLSELLLSNGYAQVDYVYGDYKYIDELCEAQEKAYSLGIGIWNNGVEDEYQNNYCNKIKYK